jgi:hypothetical protein
METSLLENNFATSMKSKSPLSKVELDIKRDKSPARRVE